MPIFRTVDIAEQLFGISLYIIGIHRAKKSFHAKVFMMHLLAQLWQHASLDEQREGREAPVGLPLPGKGAGKTVVKRIRQPCMADHRLECFAIYIGHVAREDEQPRGRATIEHCLQPSQWSAVAVQILYNIQVQEGIGHSISMTGTDEHLTAERMEQTRSPRNQCLAVGREQGFVASEPTAMASGKDATRHVKEGRRRRVNHCLPPLSDSEGENQGHGQSGDSETAFEKRQRRMRLLARLDGEDLTDDSCHGAFQKDIKRRMENTLR